MSRNFFAFSGGFMGLLASFDAYISYRYEAFDPSTVNMQQFKVHAYRLGKPGCLFHRQPHTITSVYSPFYPRNGTIIEARIDEDNPEWVQMVNGRWLQREHLDVQLLEPWPTPEQHQEDKDVASA